ncbi:hypothetical protein D3C72_1533190 [compost metagenome]
MIYINNFDLSINEKKYWRDSILPLYVAPFLLSGYILASYVNALIPNELEVKLDLLRKERVEITEKIEKDIKSDIFHSIQLNLNQLAEYYSINKSQAKSSFSISIFSIVIGFLTIISGIWLQYFNQSNVSIVILSGVSGVILEFIGGAYFFMYKKSLEQVNFFFSQLVKMQDTMISINLANSLSDESKTIEMKEKIIVSLLERSLK